MRRVQPECALPASPIILIREDVEEFPNLGAELPKPVELERRMNKCLALGSPYAKETAQAQ